jgi:hypothetical protein
MNPTKPAAWRSFCPLFNRGLTFQLVLNLGKGQICAGWVFAIGHNEEASHQDFLLGLPFFP